MTSRFLQHAFKSRTNSRLNAARPLLFSGLKPADYDTSGRCYRRPHSRGLKESAVAIAKNGSEDRIGKMDMELKEHFKEHRTFVVEALGGVKEGLTKALTKEIRDAETRLNTRIDNFEETTKNGFAVVDSRLAGMDKRFDTIDVQLKRLDNIDRSLKKLTAANKKR
jgi:hypothetical protein